MEEKASKIAGCSLLIVEELSERDRRRVSEIQELLRHQGQGDYRQAQKRAARRLGISVRSVQRLMQRWRRDGLAGVVRQERSDKGRSQLSAEWRRYMGCCKRSCNEVP
ncbi:MAG: helix-turn-helix domain-containing protein [Thainema sp.]